MTPALDLAACTASAWQLTPDLPVRLVVLAGLAGMGGWSDAQRHFPGRLAFIGLCTLLVGWVAGTTFEHAAAAAACKSTIALLTWPCIILMGPLWARFLYQYVESDMRAPSPRRWVPVLLASALLSLAALGNGAHGWLYGEATALGASVLGMPRMQYVHGPLFYVIEVWVYIWLVSAVVIILRALHDSATEDRRQWIGFLVMMLVPWSANVAYLAFGLRLFGGDPTPLSFAVAVVGFGWLIRSSSLLEVVPLSRRLLFTALPDPVLVLDSKHRVVDCNAAGQQLAGTAMPRGRLLADWPVFGAALAGLLDRSGPTAATLVLHLPGRVLDVKQTEIGDGPRHIGRLLQLRDVTDRHQAQTRLASTLEQRDEQLQQVARLQAELREQTLRDPLTGLHNRRALAQRFTQERQHQLATGQPLTLVLLDVDHFKRINDGFGHAAGDTVLMALGRTITEGLRASDTVYRIGGEEFALLMANADDTQALQRVQALRERTAGLPLLPDASPVCFSAGIATCRDGALSLDDLMRQADAALYAAKAGGRNRSVLAAQLPPPPSPA